MYFGLRQIAAPRRTWTREPKPQKNKAKVCKLRTGPPRSKKARPGQVPVKFLIWFYSSEVKILPGALLFSPACMFGEAFFFSGFFFVEKALIKLYTMA
jgi:hypothetical protein